MTATQGLAELLAEVERMTEDARSFAEALGFGDGRTEPAATLAQMVEPISDAMTLARDHLECPVRCELCGETLADAHCEECHGSGALPNAEMAYLECGHCSGAGRIHAGCVEASYADLAARAEAAEATVRRVRAVHYAADNDAARTPVCSNCNGKAGVHDCGCWTDKDRQPVCGHCNKGWKGESVPWPCPTLRALDGGEQ